MRPGASGIRRSTGSVSSCRSANQTVASRPVARYTPKIARHPETARTICPIAGATTGTRMKTIVMSDMTRAISRPSNRSRTSASVIVRGPATPMPCRNLPASIIAKLRDVSASTQPTEKSVSPAKAAGLRPTASDNGP
jgi:hypothetical protein